MKISALSGHHSLWGPRVLHVCLLITIQLLCLPFITQSAELGLFENQGDIGNSSKAGSAVFDAATGSYLVSGGGENMWFTNDAFHFVWKKLSGDVSLAADIAFPSAGGNAHRKAC